MNATVLRRCQIALLSIGAIVTVMMLVMVAGCYLDDHRIDDHRGVAIGDVVSAGTFKSAVNFYTPDGEFHSPRLGILYPTELAVGQRITVEYDVTHPDTVRVAGRSASLAILPAISIVGYTWLAIVAVMVLLAEIRRRWGPRSAQPPSAVSAER